MGPVALEILEHRGPVLQEGIHLGRIEAQFAGGGVEDSRIGLVRHDPIDLARIEASFDQHLGQDVGEIDDRVTEHLAALHAQFADGAGRGRTAIDIKHVAVAAVGVELGGKDAALAVLGFQHQCPGAVAEQDASAAVFPV